VVTLTATVQAGSSFVNPGQVKFCDADAAHCTDLHLLALAQLTGAGTASYKFIPGTGTHHYKAIFLGNNSNATSTSAISALAVTAVGAPDVATATIAATGSAGDYTLTATVAGNGSVAPTGTVSFQDTTNLNFVLRNAGLQVGATGLTLQQKSAPATGQYPGSIVTADFNGDGLPDLAVANDGLNTNAPGSLSIFLGNSDGTFRTAPSVATGDFPGSLLTGDFNGDGKPDLAAFLEETTPGVTQNVLALLGDGDGNFTHRVGAATNGAPFSGVVADFNGDGRPDLAALNQVNGVSIFLSEWTGSATATVANISPIGLGIHDVDAVYSGDANYTATTSSSTPLTGVLQPTALALTANPSSSTPGQSVTLSVSLTPDAAQNHNATGVVTFLSNGNTVGTGSIANGVASWSGDTVEWRVHRNDCGKRSLVPERPERRRAGQPVHCRLFAWGDL
jgi:hypothetical protein